MSQLITAAYPPRKVGTYLRNVHPSWLAAVVLLMLLSTPGRALLESSMLVHMMLQFPLAALMGGWLVSTLSPGLIRWIARFNRFGFSGLLFSALALALLMIPRVLDLAVANAGVDAAKLLVLALTGSSLRLSWPLAGPLLKGFFLGNVLPMMTVVGWLYLEAPQRLCNVYLLDDQWRVGQTLIWGSISLAVAWLLYTGLGVKRRWPS